LKKRRIFRTTTNTLLTLLMLSVAALFATLSVSTQGYRALLREEVVASVSTHKIAEQQFEARVRFPDGRDTVFILKGDEFYVDARILKWKPIANVLGLHTDYELDRISGRYQDLEAEQSNPRTVFALSAAKPLDLFDLRRRHPLLGWLVDAEYGSGTFIASDDQAMFDVLVSTSGLLVRKRIALNVQR
jgi:ABC-type lipoprotein release transport system permease subunit